MKISLVLLLLACSAGIYCQNLHLKADILDCSTSKGIPKAGLHIAFNVADESTFKADESGHVDFTVTLMNVEVGQYDVKAFADGYFSAKGDMTYEGLEQNAHYLSFCLYSIKSCCNKGVWPGVVIDDPLYTDSLNYYKFIMRGNPQLKFEVIALYDKNEAPEVAEKKLEKLKKIYREDNINLDNTTMKTARRGAPGKPGNTGRRTDFLFKVSE